MTDVDDIACSSICKAHDDYASQQHGFHGFQDQQLVFMEFPRRLDLRVWLLLLIRNSHPFSAMISSLPWHYDIVFNQQVVHTPSVISTSKWTKLLMVKACKSFGVNESGSKHGLLDMNPKNGSKKTGTTAARISSEGEPKPKQKGQLNLKSSHQV